MRKTSANIDFCAQTVHTCEKTLKASFLTISSATLFISFLLTHHSWSVGSCLANLGLPGHLSVVPEPLLPDFLLKLGRFLFQLGRLLLEFRNFRAESLDLSQLRSELPIEDRDRVVEAEEA